MSGTRLCCIIFCTRSRSSSSRCTAPGNRVAYFLIAAGIVFFSGSLYALALTNVRWLGAITPIGGLCFLAGWAWLIISPPR